MLVSKERKDGGDAEDAESRENSSEDRVTSGVHIDIL